MNDDKLFMSQLSKSQQKNKFMKRVSPYGNTHIGSKRATNIQYTSGKDEKYYTRDEFFNKYNETNDFNDGYFSMRLHKKY